MMAKCSFQSTDTTLLKSLDGLRHLAETRRFKAWFLDQFGVLHDGKQPYPGSIPTCAITSGELTHQYLQRRDDVWFAALGRSCIHMTWSDRGAISLEGLGLQVVENVEEAEFILAHGTEALGLPSGEARPTSLEDLEKILVLCAAKKIPMIVANPDYVTVEARALRVMPGTLASKYEKLGGEVRWMGKPDKIIYISAMNMVGVDASNSIAVGDSLHHDIKGANAAGIQSVFTTGGIHANELGLSSFGEVANLSSVQTLSSKYDAYPSYMLPAFIW
ncbi:uncharacterized protein LOC123220634 isoform X2 [Mangifera indica]|uniref:uncharacterized protein LOC123220634 isoform X2 n=1 Tax=Mangifera indica TaxID=29780 RepID=UPI001CFC2B01|nr:uncharacterized protein LOC123220634 isoform X2 [Mangifera indica]